MHMVRGKKKGVDAGAAMGASNQFSAAQLIQMEMSAELVDKKKQVEIMTAQAAESATRIAGLESELQSLTRELHAEKARGDTMRATLAKLDPSEQASKLHPHTQGLVRSCTARKARAGRIPHFDKYMPDFPPEGALVIPAPFDRLAMPLIVRICTLLSAEDVCRLGMVCRFLHVTTGDDTIWVNFYANEMMGNAAHIQSASRRERKRLLSLPFRDQYWAARPKDGVSASRAVENAVKATGKATDKVLEQIKEDNLIAKVKDRQAMIDSGQFLAEQAKTAVTTTQAFDEAKKLVDAKKGQSLNATDAALMGQTMLTQLMAKGRTVNTSEKGELKAKAQQILRDMEGLAGESVFLSTGLSRIKESANSDAEMVRLRKQGLSLARSINTPEEAKQALEENPEFVAEVKKMAMVYITEAVTSAKIPTIKGTKDWGTYDIIGVQINKLDITQDSLEVVISRVITVNVSDVSADLADFDFKYDKTTFPKIQDAGKASAQVVDLSSVIEFEIIVDEQGKLTVDNVKASIKIGALLVDVKEGSHKWLYTKLLKIFNERIKNTVEREVRKIIDKSVVALKHKAAEVTTSLSAKMSEAKREAINEGALDVDDDDDDDGHGGHAGAAEGLPGSSEAGPSSLTAAQGMGLPLPGAPDAQLMSPAVPAPRKAKKVKKTGASAMPSIEGYLEKQKKSAKLGGAKSSAKKALRTMQAVKGSSSNWQKRWFKLVDDRLAYFKSHRDEESVGDIKLSKIQDVSIDSEDATVFLITTLDGRVFTLKTKVAELASEWVTSLERAVRIDKENLGAAVGDSDEEDEVVGASVVVQFFQEHDIETVHQAIRASCLQCFETATADDVKATLASAEIALATLMGVLDELASTNNLGHVEVVNGYAHQFHELIAMKIQEMADLRSHGREWDRTESVSFVAWVADYHSRIESRVDDLSLDPKLTDLPVFEELTRRFVPRHEGYMEKKSPKTVAGKTRWQKRYFVLKNCSMYYYKSEKDYVDGQDPSGCIALDAAKELKRDAGSPQISMIVRGRKVKLRVGKESEMFVWLDNIQRSYDVAEVYANAQGGRQKVASRRSEEFDDTSELDRIQAIRQDFAVKLDRFAAEHNVVATLDAADAFLDDLTEIVDDVSGCQPPRHDITEFYVTKYHERIYEGLCQFLGNQEVLDTMEKRQVLKLVEWVYSYHDSLDKLGVDVVDKLNKVTDHPAMEHLNFLVPYRAGYLRRRVKRTQEVKKGVKAYRRYWFELKNCIISFWKEEPQEHWSVEERLKARSGYVRTNQLRSVHVDGLNFILTQVQGDKEFNLLAPNQDELDAWVAAIDQSTMRGIIKAEAFVSDVSNDAAREVFLSPFVKAWDEAADKETWWSAEIEVQPGQIICPDTIFDEMLTPVASLDEEALDESLFTAFEAIELFCDVLENVGNCYPRREDAHEWITSAFHKRVKSCLDKFVTPSVLAYSQGMIHTLMSWLYSYQEAMARCQLGELQPPLYEIPAVDTLMQRYVSEMVKVMQKWCDNLLALERSQGAGSQEAEHHPDHGFFTHVPTDMFKMVTQQMTLAQSSGLPKVVVGVCQGLTRVFEYYQDELIKRIRSGWEKWEVEYICAQVNDGSRCMDLLDDVNEEVTALVGEDWAEKIDFDTCLSGFLAVSGAASECIARSFFRDMSSLVEILFYDEWFEEAVVEELIESTTNFWSALQEEMVPDARWVKRIKTDTFHQLIYLYMETMLTKQKGSNLHTLTKENLTAIDAELKRWEEELVEEVTEISEYDSSTGETVTKKRKTGHLKPKTVGRGVDMVKDLLGLMNCNAEDLTDRVILLLEDAPDISLGIVDRVLAVRGDFSGMKSSKEKGKILKACKAAIDAKQSTSDTGGGGPGTYRVEHNCTVRVGILKSSEKVESLVKGELQKGEMVQVIDCKESEGLTRLHVQLGPDETGWASQKSAAGKTMLRKVLIVETVFTELQTNHPSLRKGKSK